MSSEDYSYYDEDVYDNVEEDELLLSERQTLNSFKNVRSVWNIVFLLAYLPLGAFCLGHIIVHRRKFKSAFISLLFVTILIKLFIVFYRDLFLIYDFSTIPGINRGFVDFLEYHYFFHEINSMVLIIALAAAETTRYSRKLNARPEILRTVLAWTIFILFIVVIFTVTFLLEFDVLGISYAVDTPFNTLIWTLPFWLIFFFIVCFRSLRRRDQWNFWEMSFTKIVILFMITQLVVLILGVAQHIIYISTDYSRLVSEYTTMGMLFLVDLVDVLQLVFYLLMFRTKNEKILPCWNSKIDSRGYELGNTNEMT